MSRITISDDVCIQLNGFSTPNEICDGTGHLLGYLVPTARYAELLAAWQREEADLDELDRLAQEKDVGTLQELWKELGVE